MRPSRKSPPSAVVGLDIGSDSIKISEARYGKDGITITGLGVARTPEGVIENEVILDPQALGKAVKALITESGIKTRKCVSSVGGQSQVVVRIIEVPQMSRDELAETMKWEIERHVPFAANEIVKDFQPLERPNPDPNSQNMEVLLAVAQQELITRHVETLQAAGLQPMAIDIEPLAESRALIETLPENEKNGVIAIINIGANRTDVGIFENGCLTFPSPPLAIAGVNITREIAEALGQTMEEAEATKKEYAAVDVEALLAPAPAADPVDTAQAAEPTSFNTVFDTFNPAETSGTSAFDVEEPAATEPEPQTEQFSAFQDTVDGPVFDLPEENTGPAFDLGDDVNQVSSGPSFDFSPTTPVTEGTGPVFDVPDTQQAETEPAASAFAFDLGGDEQPTVQFESGPAFDLDDEEPAQEDPGKPDFDLTDADEFADPGEAVVHTPVAPSAPRPQPGSMEAAVFQAISGVVVDLATEIRRSLEYYVARYSKLPDKVYVCGGTAKMPRLAEFLSNELGVPVEVADPVKNVKSKVTGASDQYLKEVSPLFAVSIGLAIRDMIG